MMSREVSADWRNLYDEVNELDRPRKSMTSFHLFRDITLLTILAGPLAVSNSVFTSLLKARLSVVT